jgi:hypothetical protein
MANSLMYPIALHKGTQKLVNIDDVVNGKACNCYCYECKQDMIAINNENNTVQSHFRHDNNSNCSVSFESYLHWLTKEIFKETNVIKLPELESKILFPYITEHNKYLFKKNNTPKFLEDKINYEILKDIKKRLIEIKYDRVEIEKEYQTSLGSIRVDVVLTFFRKNGKEKTIFIEPFMSNPINYTKIKKLKELNISTLSINLNKFLNIKAYFFKKEDLKIFLINNIISKEWKHYNATAILYRDFDNYIKKRIKENDEFIIYHQSLIENEKDLKNKIKIMSNDIELLKECIIDKYDEISILKNKIENIPYI